MEDVFIQAVGDFVVPFFLYLLNNFLLLYLAFLWHLFTCCDGNLYYCPTTRYRTTATKMYNESDIFLLPLSFRFPLRP